MKFGDDHPVVDQPVLIIHRVQAGMVIQSKDSSLTKCRKHDIRYSKIMIMYVFANTAMTKK